MEEETQMSVSRRNTHVDKALLYVTTCRSLPLTFGVVTGAEVVGPRLLGPRPGGLWTRGPD